MKKIAGRYEVTATLGEGGMGIVFRAYDPPPMDRDVAVKTLHEYTDKLALDLFYDEFRVLKSISHPNIVEIFDIGEYEEGGRRQPFFVMPLLQGQTLHEIISKESHRLTVQRVVDIMTQTCRGLQAAHDRRLIHRDLKPSNIFVMADDSVKLIDFGVVHVIDAHSRSAGFDKGTLPYMAAEQVQHKPVSVQSDIYSLGVVCYEALTRRQPFRLPTEEEVRHAILTTIPPPASEINSHVSQTISRVVHKAMAKQPWHRFDSAREFGDTLQRAFRNEPIELFDPARIRPRIVTAERALDKGDYQFAAEIVGELEAEGNIDPQITLLRTRIDQVARQRTIAQLLESARARYEEEEDPLALHKIQEILRLDPNNMAALGLKSRIDDRRSERQIEKWVKLAREHVDNHSYGHAREALQNVLAMRPNDARAARMVKEIEAEEQEYLRLWRQKTNLYQAALNAWKNGEVSRALSQMKVVLELDRRAPDASSPETAGTYQSFYDRLRSDHDAISSGYADARRLLDAGNFVKALDLCREFLAKYPGQALFQALEFDVEEQQRQQLSAFIAATDRRLDAEGDLDVKVTLLREAVAAYPEEPHFDRLLRLLQDKRDLVNGIVARTRQHEERGEVAEAIADLDTLQTIYPAYPGLKFERERLQHRLEQDIRHAAKASWVAQVDRQLEIGNHVRAGELLDRAQAEFPDEGEFVELRKLALQLAERSARAEQLLSVGRAFWAEGDFDAAVDRLRNALQLDNRQTIRLTLRDVFADRARSVLADDIGAAESFADRALELDPQHALAKSLREQAQAQRREQFVTQCASQARRLQADGDIEAALEEIGRGLGAYPSDARLTGIRDTLLREAEQSKRRARLGDLEQLRTIRGEAAVATDEQQLQTMFERTRGIAARYEGEEDLQAIAQEIERIVQARGGRRLEEDAPRQDPPNHLKASSWRTRWSALPVVPRPALIGIVSALLLIAGASWLYMARRATGDALGGTLSAGPIIVPQPHPLLISVPALDEGEVWLDGRRTGTLEAGALRLEPPVAGPHVLRVASPAEGVPRAEISFEMGPSGPVVTGMDIPARQAALVVAGAGAIRVHAGPAASAVSIDGQPLAAMPRGGFEVRDVPPGLHELTFAMGGDARRAFIATSVIPSLDVLLFSDRNTGSAIVVTGEDDARVSIDGQLQARRTREGVLRIANIEPRAHVFRVDKEGFQPFTVDAVTIEKGRETLVTVTLVAADRFATLTARQLAPGTQVSVDGTAVGLVGTDGTFSFASVPTGARALTFTRAGRAPVRLVRQFAAGETVVVSGADLPGVAGQGSLDMLATQDVQIAILRDGQPVTRVTGSARVSLDAGTYTLVATGPAGVDSSATVTLAVAQTRKVDLQRIVVTGMERFEQRDGWTLRDGWFRRRGGEYVLYDAPFTAGKYSFTISLDRSPNPFSNGPRLKWVVGYRDRGNLLLLELDGSYLYRTEIIAGRRRELARVGHSIPRGGEVLHLSVDVTNTSLTHQYSVDGSNWRALDAWSSANAFSGPEGTPTSFANGRFGFFLPGGETIDLANFRFFPPRDR